MRPAQVVQEVGLEPADVLDRHVVQVAVAARPDRDHLLLDRERRVLRLLEQLDQPRAAVELRAGGRVQVGRERGERLQVAVLRQVEAQVARDRLHRLDLRVAADSGDRAAHVDGGPHARVEQVGLQEDLPVGDRDDVGRDVGGDVVGLGLDDRQAGQRPAAQLVGQLGAPLEQPGVQVEDVARVRLAARRAAQQQRDRAVRLGLLGQVVEDDQRVLALVHPVLRDGRTGVGRDVLVAGRVRGRGGDDRGVLERARLLQGPAHLGDRGALLADRDVDAAHLADRVAGLPVRPLVDDRVDGDGALAGLPVADDQLPLAPADRGHRVDGLDAGLQRLLHRLPLHHRRRLGLEQPQLGVLDGALAVQRLAQRADHAAEEAVADRHGQHLAGALDLLAFLDLVELAEDDHADLAHVQVERQAPDAVLELEQLVGHGGGQALDPRDAVAALDDGAYLFPRGTFWLVFLDEVRQRVPDLFRPDRQLSHGPLCLSVRGLPASRLPRRIRSHVGQPASFRRTAASLRAAVPSMSSSPIWTEIPPMTAGSSTMFRCTRCP